MSAKQKAQKYSDRVSACQRYGRQDHFATFTRGALQIFLYDAYLAGYRAAKREAKRD